MQVVVRHVEVLADGVQAYETLEHHALDLDEAAFPLAPLIKVSKGGLFAADE